jgi:hypothetical protein
MSDLDKPAMTDEERVEFLTVYEDLGPGGLTPDEIIELATLRAKSNGDAGQDDDGDLSDINGHNPVKPDWFVHDRFIVRISIAGKCFKNIEEAQAARDKVKYQYYGEYSPQENQ